jgi:HAD superfamily hydrolase (TIGR01509 family)
MTFPAGVLWDMDGTLIDSEPLWLEAQQELVASFGRLWTREDGEGLVGTDMFTSAAVLRSRGVDLPMMEIMHRLSEAVAERIRRRPVWRPGAQALLNELRRNAIPMALVTSSPRIVADAVLSLLVKSPFLVSIALEDVDRPKPHPEPYLRAAQLLSVAIHDCVAFEDSRPGLLAAVASGAKTVAVPHMVDLPEGAGASIWSTLEGRAVHDLAALFVAAPVHA